MDLNSADSQPVQQESQTCASYCLIAWVNPDGNQALQVIFPLQDRSGVQKYFEENF